MRREHRLSHWQPRLSEYFLNSLQHCKAASEEHRKWGRCICGHHRADQFRGVYSSLLHAAWDVTERHTSSEAGPWRPSTTIITALKTQCPTQSASATNTRHKYPCQVTNKFRSSAVRLTHTRTVKGVNLIQRLAELRNRPRGDKAGHAQEEPGLARREQPMYGHSHQPLPPTPETTELYLDRSLTPAS